MKPFGTQLIAEFLDCQQFELLRRTQSVQTLLAAGIEQAGMNLRQLVVHQFEPEGVTAVAIIGESHVALHTYPESHHLAIDIFTCTPGSQGPERLLHFLQAHLQPKQIRRVNLSRGQKIVLCQVDRLTDLSKASHDISYHIETTLYHQRSEWQEIQIIVNPSFGRMLFLDQELQIAESDQIYHQTLVEPLYNHPNILQVAILGGGDGGVLREVFERLPALQQVWLLELDPQVCTASERYLPQICGSAFQDPRLKFHFGDVLQHLPALPQVDAIISDLGMSPWRHAGHAQEYYLQQLLTLVMDRLRPQGIFSLQIGPRSEPELQQKLSDLLTQHLHATHFNEVFVPSFCEPWIFAWGLRP